MARAATGPADAGWRQSCDRPKPGSPGEPPIPPPPHQPPSSTATAAADANDPTDRQTLVADSDRATCRESSAEPGADDKALEGSPPAPGPAGTAPLEPL